MDQAEEEAPLQDTFILGGQPWLYTDQPWHEYPAVATELAIETRALHWRYWSALHGGPSVFEDGEQVSPARLRARVGELQGALWNIVPYVPEELPLAVRLFRRAIH